jgi:hypothetical protein
VREKWGLVCTRLKKPHLIHSQTGSKNIYTEIHTHHKQLQSKNVMSQTPRKVQHSCKNWVGEGGREIDWLIDWEIITRVVSVRSAWREISGDNSTMMVSIVSISFLQFLTIPTTTKQDPPTINFFALIYVTTQSHSSCPSHKLTFLSSAAETSEFLLCLKYPTFNFQSIVWFSIKIFANKKQLHPILPSLQRLF